MRTLKRSLLTLSFALLCLVLLTGTALAANLDSGTCGENATWVLDGSYTLTISGTGDMTDHWSEDGDYAPWRAYRTQIKKVVIRSGVTGIGRDAFYEHTGLTTVVMANSVTSIGEYAFSGCTNLAAINLPDSITDLGWWAFEDCTGLTSVTIPGGVTEIGYAVFEGCSGLTAVSIPAGVTEIDPWAFEDCTALQKFTVASNNTAYFSDARGVLFTKDQTTLLRAPHALSGGYAIPGTVTTVSDEAFRGCTKLTALTIPNTVTSIGFYAFEGCTGLTALTIPASVSDLSDYAFDGCSRLAKITVDANNRYYASDSSGVLFTKNMATLLRAPMALSGSYVIPGTVTDFSYGAFDGCAALTALSIPASVTELDKYIFYGCTGLQKFTVAAGNPNYFADSRGVLFTKDQKTLLCAPGGIRGSYTVPATVTTIDDEAFLNCSGLTFVSLPQSVKHIGFSAFEGCTGMTAVMLPTSVTYIGSFAFDYCDRLTTVYYAGTQSNWSDIEIGSGNPFESLTIRYQNNGLIDTPSVTVLRSTVGGVQLSWNAVPGAGKYRVFAKTSKGWLKLGDTAGTRFTWSGAKLGLTYIFTVRAMNSEANQYLSSFNAAGWRHTYTPTPAISRFDNLANGIRISWDPINGAAKYRVFARTSKGWLKLGDTTDTSFTWTAAKPGLTYTFTIRCLNEAGTAFTTPYHTTGWKQTYVAQPAIKSFQNTADGIKITWNATAGAGKYRVFAKTSKGWLKLGDTTGTSFTWSGARSGLTYTFTVRAINAAATAFVSSYNTAGWKHQYIAQPAISELSGTDQGIRITWDKVNGAAKYTVFAKTSKGWVAIGTTADTSFTWSAPQKGYTYYFTLRCLNKAETGFTSSYDPSGWSVKYT